MKSDVLLGLQSASWPVLLVNEASRICSANAAASRVFGEENSQGAVSPGTLWAGENEMTCAQFLSLTEISPAQALAKANTTAS